MHGHYNIHSLTSGTVHTTFLIPESVLRAVFNHHRVLHRQEIEISY